MDLMKENGGLVLLRRGAAPLGQHKNGRPTEIGSSSNGERSPASDYPARTRTLSVVHVPTAPRNESAAASATSFAPQRARLGGLRYPRLERAEQDAGTTPRLDQILAPRR